MAFFSKSLRNWTKKHDFIEGLTEWSPTEYAELTEFTAENSPTDFRCNFRGCTCLKCTNQANSDPPTDFTLSLQKNATQSHKLQNDQGKTMIAKDSFVPLL